MDTTSGSIAVIGIGSNSVRLLITGREEKGRDEHKERKEAVTRLASYVLSGNEQKLQVEAIEETVDAVIGFARHANERSASLIAVIATEAVRASSNSRDLTERLERELDVPVTVISGDEEARLGWLAVSTTYARSDAPLGVIDVGGGSTDLSVGYPGSELPEAVASIPMGGRTAMRRFGLDRAIELSKLWGTLAAVSIETSSAATSLKPRPQVAVAIGGTATVLSVIYQAQNPSDNAPYKAVIERDWLARWVPRMSLQAKEGRIAQGVPANRADIIVAGGVILLSLLEAWGLQQFSISEHNILDGFIAQSGK